MMVCIAFGCSCGPSANSPGSEQLGYPEPHPSPASWADIAASLRARVARFLSMPAYRSPAVEPKDKEEGLALRDAFRRACLIHAALCNQHNARPGDRGGPHGFTVPHDARR